MLYEFDHQALSSFTTTSDSPETNEQLMARIQARDETALSTLYRRHAALLRTIIARVVNNDEDTSDVLQEVLVECWNHAGNYDPTKGKLLGWLITLARRRAIDRVRRRQAYNRVEERNRLQVEAEAPQMVVGADEDACSADRAELLKRVLDTLPEAQRAVLELAFYRGLSQREIAAKTNIPLGTIKTRIELGVRKVRTAVLAMGGVEEWNLTHA